MKSTIVIRIDEEIKQELLIICEDNDITISELLRMLINKFLEGEVEIND